MMENNNYSSYIFNTFNGITLIFTVLSFFGIQIFMNTWELKIAVLAFFIFILLLITSMRIYKDKNRVFERYEEIKKSNKSLEEEKLKIQERFDNQSIKYNESIDEKNAYKSIFHLVEVIVHAQEYKTLEAKRLVQTLKYSIDKSIERNDKK